MRSAMKSLFCPSSAACADRMPPSIADTRTRMASATWYTMMGCRNSSTFESMAAVARFSSSVVMGLGC